MTYGATAIYYTIINEQVQKRLGGASSASMLLQSFNHAEMGDLFTTGRWDVVTEKFVAAAKNLKAAGADGIMICCNIAHKVADELERQSGLPLLHIVDFTGARIREMGITKVALLGTKPVMEEGFFINRLKQKYDIEVVVPTEQKRDAIHNMIFKELGANIITPRSKELLLEAIRETLNEGAQGVIFACTELQFVVKPEDVDIPLWDTMEGHAIGAAKWAVADQK
jgi:aspartate racemase